MSGRIGDRDGDLERRLREKEDELEILQEGMDQTLLELNEMRIVRWTSLIALGRVPLC